MSEVEAATAEQRAAIEARDRDGFCEAGAGTGKTRVLVGRYCDAIELDGLGIEAILAFTFTERAAAELRTRIRRELVLRGERARRAGDAELGARLERAGRESGRAWVTTIHGFCRRLLATHPAAAGIDPRFRVLAEGEASRLRRRAREEAVEEVAASDRASVDVIAAYRPERIGEMAIAAYERLRSQGMSVPRLPTVADPVRSVKDAAKEEPPLSPAEAAAAQAARRTLERILIAYGERYEALKTERSGLDFADLELRALALLRDSPAVSVSWRGRFEHVMVDEFQDTNRVQLDLVEELRGPRTKVFRVGDELQSIYRFRNADLAVFRAERERAAADPATASLSLSGNFRARPEIVAAVNLIGEAIVGDSYTPLAAALPPASSAGEPAVDLLLTLDEGRRNGWAEHERALELPPSERQAKLVAEARGLAERLRELVDAGEARPGEIVVLLRAFTHVDAYEEALERAGLNPYAVGGRGYWSQQQVEDLLRLLETVANPLDDEMLLGALASPAVAVSPDALWLLRRASVEEGEDGARRSPPHLWPLIEWRFGSSAHRPEVADERRLEAIPQRDAERMRRFCALIGELRAAAPLLALDTLVERTMVAFDYDLWLLRRERGRGRMANVRKLMRLAREFEAHEGRDLRGFLASAQELTERDEREGLAAVQAEDHDGVRIMTVHAAKGLEFPVVAVPDLARGLAQGERDGDVVLGRVDPELGDRSIRFGLRLALPAADSLGTWEMHELHAENKDEAAEEGARLVHVAATRAERRLILSGVFRAKQLERAERAPGDGALQRLLPALAERGLTLDSPAAELELPAAPAGAAGAPARAPRIAIRINTPAAERAAELALRRAPVRGEDEGAGELRPAPLTRPAAVTPVGHLSYSALADYERCAYRFYAERMLGIATPPGRGHPEAAADGEPAAEAATGAVRDRRLGFGNAVHAALERSANEGWAAPGNERLAALLAAEGAGGEEELARARAMIDGWLGSELLAEVARAESRSEVPFALELGGAIVRGQIDLLVRARGPVEGQLELLGAAGVPTVIDFKTDRLDERGAEPLAGRYASQRELYALALDAAGARGPARAEQVRAIHVFLEAPGEPVSEVFDAARLAAAGERLRSLIALIRGGRFEPTPSPSHSVCFGCPAAERLCPHPKWRPSR